MYNHPQIHRTWNWNPRQNINEYRTWVFGHILRIWGWLYPLWWSNMAGWKIEFSTGNTASNGSFSSAMLVYQSVFFWIWHAESADPGRRAQLLFLCSIQNFVTRCPSKIPSPKSKIQDPQKSKIQNPKSPKSKIQNPKSPKSKIQNPNFAHKDLLHNVPKIQNPKSPKSQKSKIQNPQNPKSKIPKIQNPKSPKSKIQNPKSPQSKIQNPQNPQNPKSKIPKIQNYH